jgi:hypothetical protein
MSTEEKELQQSLSDLSEESINFGKYKDLTLDKMLKDRKYCSWLLQQEWFQKQYEFLYNKVKEHNPLKNFFQDNRFGWLIPENCTLENFLNNYPYFYMKSPENLVSILNEVELKCYKFYFDTIESFKEKMIKSQSANIKAPTSWLLKFEKKYELSRDIFKEFLNSNDLPNIPYLIEDIKKVAGIVYKGGRSFLIAKENSVKQEEIWEKILKNKYGEDISSQYKYKNCIFDFIHIKNNILFECKLAFKDFNEDQYNKYMLVLGVYNIKYLISDDCVVDISKKILLTTDPKKYKEYFTVETKIGRGGKEVKKEFNKLELVIKDFKIVYVENIEEGI